MMPHVERSRTDGNGPDLATMLLSKGADFVAGRLTTFLPQKPARSIERAFLIS